MCVDVRVSDTGIVGANPLVLFIDSSSDGTFLCVLSYSRCEFSETLISLRVTFTFMDCG